MTTTNGAASMLRVTIKTDNDAFTPDPGPELARILRNLAARLEHLGPDTITLRDSNGNAVGKAVLS